MKCRWNQLLHDVPDSELDLTLDEVPAEAFPGFEVWLCGRLQGPLARELRRLQLGIASDAFAAHQLRLFEALGHCRALTELKVRPCFSKPAGRGWALRQSSLAGGQRQRALSPTAHDAKRMHSWCNLPQSALRSVAACNFSRAENTRSLRFQMLRQVRSAMRYSEFDWGGVAALPPTLQRLDLTHFNLAFQLNDRGDSCAAHSVLQKHKAMAHRRC